MAPAAQLELKRGLVGDELDRHDELDGVALARCLPSPKVLGYRNRAKLAVALEHGTASLGYFREGTRHLVDAPECRVLEPELLATLESLRRLLPQAGSGARALRHVDLRCGSDPARQHLVLVADARRAEGLPLQEIRAACPLVTGISVNLHPGEGSLVLKGPIEHAWGEREVWVDLPSVRLRVSPGSFFQVNLSILPALHERMAAFLGEGRALVDLYAGVGTHGLALREPFDRVVMIEGVRRAAGDAKASAALARAGNVRVVASPVEHALRAMHDARPDAVVLNPSRAGALDVVLQAIARSGARRVAYLSCDPRTLARDLATLVRAGLEPIEILPLDMMPQTRHVEALALLENGGG
jgi:23S rRNA (uracil1939-C5)-methyltransferase